MDSREGTLQTVPPFGRSHRENIGYTLFNALFQTTIAEPVVDPIGPNLMSENFTVASACSLSICRHTRVNAASTTVRSWLRTIGGVGAVQPEHVCVVVIPQRHDKNHTCIDSLLDSVQSALLQKIRAILGGGNPVTAEVIGDGVMGLSIDGVGWVLDGLAVLLVELPHFDKFARVGAIVCDELRGHCDGLSAVNLEVGAWTKEVVSAQSVRLDVTTVLVTQAAEAIFTIVTTVLAVATSLLSRGARMHRVRH